MLEVFVFGKRYVRVTGTPLVPVPLDPTGDVVASVLGTKAAVPLVALELSALPPPHETRNPLASILTKTAANAWPPISNIR